MKWIFSLLTWNYIKSAFKQVNHTKLIDIVQVYTLQNVSPQYLFLHLTHFVYNLVEINALGYLKGFSYMISMNNDAAFDDSVHLAEYSGTTREFQAWT